MCFIYDILYTLCALYTFYTLCAFYWLYSLFQVRQDLGLADHVWSNKKKSIAENLDNLGPAMRAGWLSYISRVYWEEEGEADVDLIVGEDTLVVDDWVYAAAGCYKPCSSVMDDEIGL